MDPWGHQMEIPEIGYSVVEGALIQASMENI